MSEETWKKAWDVFASAWAKLCDYHKGQADEIHRAMKKGWLSPSQALYELSAIRQERAMCKECI